MERYKMSEALKEVRDIFSNLPECTEKQAEALEYAISLAKQDEENNLLMVDKDYWFQYYDVVKNVWKDKDGNYLGESIKIIKEADPKAKEAEMTAEYNSEQQDQEDNMASFGGLLGGLMGGFMGGVFPPEQEDIIDAEYTEATDVVEPVETDELETESNEE